MKLVVLSCLMAFVVGGSASTLEGKDTSSNSNGGHIAVGKDISDETGSFMDKIVGGSVASPGEIPWQASMKPLSLENGLWTFEHMCGATIISEYWLISAAHCFRSPTWKWRVTVGEFNMLKEDSIYNHELYGQGKDTNNDIALVKIKPSMDGRGIQFSQLVNYTCIPVYDSLEDDTELLVSGWGGLHKSPSEDEQVYPELLHKAVVRLINQKTCEEAYPFQITDSMFCAGYMDGQVDSCQGDSGGPIVYTSQGSTLLYGVVSWGGGCAQPNNPGVYARVSKFSGWILATTQLHSDFPAQTRIGCLV